MAEMTKDELRKKAEIIRDETQDGANTAERVGGCLVDIVDRLPDGGGEKKDTVLYVNCIGARNSTIDLRKKADGKPERRPSAGYLLCAYFRGQRYGGEMQKFITYVTGDAAADRENVDVRNGEIYELDQNGRYRLYGYAHEYKEVRSSAKAIRVNCTPKRWEVLIEEGATGTQRVEFEKIDNGSLYYPFIEYRKRNGNVGLMAIPNFDGITNGVRTVEEARSCVKDMFHYERGGRTGETLKEFVDAICAPVVGFERFMYLFSGKEYTVHNPAQVMEGKNETNGGAKMRSNRHDEDWRYSRYPYIKIVFCKAKRKSRGKIRYGTAKEHTTDVYFRRRAISGEVLCEFHNRKLAWPK